MNKQTKLSIGVMLIYPVCFVLVIALLIYRGLSALPDTSIINISIDLFGMLMGYVLYVCCRFDAEKSDSNLKYFFYLHNAAYLGLFVDAVSWLVDGVAQLRMINVIDNYLYFMCAPLQAFCYYKYISNVIRLEGKGYRILDKIMSGGLILGIAVRLLNVFFGHYFKVSADGVYSRGFLYPLSMLYVFFTLIAMMVVIIKERKQFDIYASMTAAKEVGGDFYDNLSFYPVTPSLSTPMVSLRRQMLSWSSLMILPCFHLSIL